MEKFHNSVFFVTQSKSLLEAQTTNTVGFFLFLLFLFCLSVLNEIISVSPEGRKRKGAHQASEAVAQTRWVS